MTQFNIGDTVYQASAGQEGIWVACPECLGSGRLRVIMGDDSEVSIACVCCDRGYEGSQGRIATYQFRASVTQHTVSGIEAQQRDSGVRVRYSFGCYSNEAENVFATREEAMARAAVIVTEHEAEETKRLKHKMKDSRKWSWNVHYYRAEIRRAEETIKCMKERLAVAPKNIKDLDKLKA
jgi:hypothetical protein